MNEPYFRKIATRRLEDLLQKFSYERTQHSLAPKNEEEKCESEEKVRNEIWDLLERERSEIKSHLVVTGRLWTSITDKSCEIRARAAE